MTDFRKQERSRAQAYLNVFDKNSQQNVGHIVDMSRYGIGLYSVIEFETNGQYQFVVSIPFEINGKTEICFDALCVWCAPREDSNGYDAGFMLGSVSEEESQRIDSLMKNPIFVDSTDLVNVTVSKTD